LPPPFASHPLDGALGSEVLNLRIRTVARLTGISEATLRAWERRYGFPSPVRGKNNYRSYSREEVEALCRVAALLEEGFSASEAIGQVRAVPEANLSHVERLAERFWSSLAALDTEGADAVLAEAQKAMAPVLLCDSFLLPLLRQMAERLDVAREHLASALVRQRLRGLAQSLGPAFGPKVVLACPEGEQHEGGLLGLAVHLKAAGCRLTLLGADTPLEAVVVTARTADAEVVALSFVNPRPVQEMEAYVRAVVDSVRAKVVVGGAFADVHRHRVAAAGAHFGETAEEVKAALDVGPLPGAR
jgi:DNA-binding transcriptional MerR regulator/methylmalonyl-CoA mutase cobalamin-binding subunit